MKTFSVHTLSFLPYLTDSGKLWTIASESGRLCSEMKKFSLYSLVRFPIAAILLFSAVMKSYATVTEPTLYFPWFEILSVEFEFLLALSLLLNLCPKLTRWIAMGTFFMFLMIAVRLAWLAADSCGCFGKLHVDPRITVILDLTVFLFLFFAKVPDKMTFPHTGQVRCFLFGTLLTLIPLVAMGRPHPPTIVEHTPAKARQTTREHDFDYVEPQSVHRFSFLIDNPTERDWTVLAVRSECDCLKVLEAPKMVGPGQVLPLPMEFHVPKEKQFYTKKIVVQTDDPDHPEIEFRIFARIGIPLAVRPKQVLFENVTPGEQRQTTVTVINSKEQPIKLLYSKSSPPICYAKIPAEPVPPNGKLDLTIVLRTPKEQTDNRNLDLMIQTNEPDQRTITIPVRAELPKQAE